MAKYIELIDRQALKDAVKRYAGEPIKEKDRKCQAICLDMLGTIDAQPTASPWRRVEDELPDRDDAYVVGWRYPNGCFYWGKVLFFNDKWQVDEEIPTPDYWMPIEPPKEDA